MIGGIQWVFLVVDAEAEDFFVVDSEEVVILQVSVRCPTTRHDRLARLVREEASKPCSCSTLTACSHLSCVIGQ